jgi:hypothetical protein
LVHELDHEQPKTTKDLLNIATQHTSIEGALGVVFILGSAAVAAEGGRTAPTKGARKGAKGGKKGQKWWPHRVTIVAGNSGGDEEVSDSNEEYVVAVEHNFQCQIRLPKDHFEKLLKATYPHHSYPVKHKLKLKDYTLMKKFMMSRAFSNDRKLGRDPGGKSVVPILGEAEVMTTFGRPHHGPGDTM